MRAPLSVTGLIAGILLAGSAAGAQTAVRPETAKLFEVTPYAGYMIFGSIADGPLGTSLRNANSALYGAQLSMALAPSISLVGNIATSDADVQVGLPFLGGYSIGHSTVDMYDAGLQMELPHLTTSGIPLTPFVQAGIGAMHYRINESVIRTSATNFATSLGAGIDVPLSPTFGIRFMARDYIGKFNFKDATQLDLPSSTSNNFGITAGVRLNF